MPIYEFSCNACGHDFEELIRNSGEKAVCPQCGSKKCLKLMSAASFRSPKNQGAATSGSSGSRGCAGCSANSCVGCSR